VQQITIIEAQAILNNQLFNSNDLRTLQGVMSGYSLPPEGGYGFIIPDIRNLFAKNGA
jgi:hypothetical protein